ARRIIGAAIEVHRTIGPGFPEVVYERALCIELGLRGIAFERQPVVTVSYKGFIVGEGRLDFIAQDVGIELKAVYALQPIARSFTPTSKSTGHRLGLLFNFETPTLTIRRVIESRNP